VISWRSTVVCLLVLLGLALAGANILSYRDKFAAKEAAAKLVGASIQSPPADDDIVDGKAGLAERSRLYRFLTDLGREKDLHNGTPYGVVILDPDFYRGVYIDKPTDTVLPACAIQPFVVPALTGMPLLSPFSPESGQCKYESYGYQYLAPRQPMTGDASEAPCKLALARGFSHVVVIKKADHAFQSKRMDCAT